MDKDGVMIYEEGMDENVVMGFGEEYEEEKYEYPIGALAKNIKESDERQFISKQEKAKIKEIDSIKKAFWDGCNTLMSGCTACGRTPDSNSPSDIASAITEIYNNRYNQGIKDATPSIERKDFSVSVPEKEIESLYYTIESSGTAYIALHMFAHQKYDCAQGVSTPGFEVLIDGMSVFKNYSWENRKAQDEDTVNIDCFVNVDVTAGQVLELKRGGGYLCDAHLGGSVIIVS